MPEPAKKVLLIGWDAADWKVINPLIDKGVMPNLENLIDRGVMGNLASLYPMLSPMLWTSIATGKRPFKHGVLGFSEPDPRGRGIRPITNLSRQARAIWNILTLRGKKSIVVGWWPSHPAEPINGVMVSNRYQRPVGFIDKPWPLAPAAVHPPRLYRNMKDLRVHPQSLDIGLIKLFVPRLADIDQEKDHRIETLAKTISETTSIYQAALAAMHHEPWDLTAVYFDAIDHFGHGFMRYHPPRLPWVNEDMFDRYKEVVTAGYRYHDILLGGLLEEAGPDATVILVSDHGFHPDHLRPQHIPNEPAGPAAAHRPHGILAIKGPGIKHDEIIYGATLLDICPTVLTMLDMPVGEDMDGKPLVNAFDPPPDLEWIPSWDDIEGEDGSHSSDASLDPVESQEAITQLVALGYIEKPDENQQRAVARTIRELDYNLVRSYMDAGFHIEAIPLLQDLVEKWPYEHRYAIHLVECYKATGQIEEARHVLEETFQHKGERAADAREKLKELKEKYKDKKLDELDEKVQREFKDLYSAAGRNMQAIEYLTGALLCSEGKQEEALVHLEKAEKAGKTVPPGLYIKIGDVFLKMKRWKEAQERFQKALDLDPENAHAYLGLCRTYLHFGHVKEAVEAALRSIGLLYHNPHGHFLLGVGMFRLGRMPRAVEALKVSLSQNPAQPKAHSLLAAIYKRQLKDPEQAAMHRSLARKSIELIQDVKQGKITRNVEEETIHVSETSDQALLSAREIAVVPGPVDLSRTITIVSGLPRSGTSMMMQMLQAGGMPLLTDSIREPDQNNPRGYFEYELAAKLRTSRAWLPEVRGKAVKIVAQLLHYLPLGRDYRYRIVIMERDLHEVIASQNKMLQRKKDRGNNLSDGRLMKAFSQQIRRVKYMLSARLIPTIMIEFKEGIEQPEQTAARINAFLGGGLDEKAMAAAVSPELYRTRTA